jgi:hypothetical protein
MVLYLKNTMKQEFFDKRIYSYITEELGRYFTIECRFSLIDGFTKVTDKDAVYTRKLLLKKVFSLEFSWSCHKGITTKGAF